MELARACAVLGVTPSASLREAKRAYKKLVKRWHPDRFANDPQGQAEATARLQMITEAYQTVAHALGPASAIDSGPKPEGGSPRHEPGAPLPREEVERLIHSLGTEGPLDRFFKRPMWWWPLPFGVMFLLPTHSPAYEWHFAGGVLLIALSPILWWLERRRPSG